MLSVFLLWVKHSLFRADCHQSQLKSCKFTFISIESNVYRENSTFPHDYKHFMKYIPKTYWLSMVYFFTDFWEGPFITIFHLYQRDKHETAIPSIVKRSVLFEILRKVEAGSVDLHTYNKKSMVFSFILRYLEHETIRFCYPANQFSHCVFGEVLESVTTFIMSRCIYFSVCICSRNLQH